MLVLPKAVSVMSSNGVPIRDICDTAGCKSTHATGAAAAAASSARSW